MRKFQRLGFIDYTDGLKINNSPADRRPPRLGAVETTPAPSGALPCSQLRPAATPMRWS